MRNLLKTLAAASLLFLGTSASAQYRTRDEFPNSDREHQDQLMDRLRSDLSIAETSATTYTGDRPRIERALDEVNALQYRVDSGNYDGRQFDRTIRAVQEVLHQNLTLPGRTWDALTDDASQLRVFETQSADWR